MLLHLLKCTFCECSIKGTLNHANLKEITSTRATLCCWNNCVFSVKVKLHYCMNLKQSVGLCSPVIVCVSGGTFSVS